MTKRVCLTEKGIKELEQKVDSFKKDNNLTNSTLEEKMSEDSSEDSNVCSYDTLKRLLKKKEKERDYILINSFNKIKKYFNLSHFKEGTHFYYREDSSINADANKLINEQSNKQATLKDKLTEILNRYYSKPTRKIYQAYNWSLLNRPIPRTIGENQFETLNSLVSNLDLPQLNNEAYSCLHKFLGNLCYYQDLDEELNQELKILIENNIENIENIERELTEDKKNREQQCKPGLFVIVNKEYIVEAWLINNLEEYDRIPPKEQKDYTQLKFTKHEVEKQTDRQLSNMSQLLKELIYRSYEKCTKEIAQIHIFLPYQLMNHDIDSWQLDNEKIVDKYQVILRCSERLEGDHSEIHSWKKKGNVLKNRLNDVAGEKILVLNESNNITALETYLKIERQTIAMKITNVFTNEQPGKLLYKHSIPIAVWIRKQINVNNRLEINNLLKKRNESSNESSNKTILLKELPEQVRVRRIQVNGENDAGRHICLLWDDPNLLPPKQLLTQRSLI